MPKNLPLAGSKFGKLTILESTDEVSAENYRLWLCECECGKRIKLPGSKLARGRVAQSCGCVRLHKGRKAHNIAGKRFHKLTAMRRVGRSPTCGSVLWECRCDCGTIVMQKATRLIKGKAKKSCGCDLDDRRKRQMLMRDAKIAGVSTQQFEELVASGRRYCRFHRGWHLVSAFSADKNRADGLKPFCRRAARVMGKKHPRRNRAKYYREYRRKAKVRC